MYAKFIDNLRKIVALIFGISGIGLIVCGNPSLLWSPLLATTFEFIVLACLITAFGLFVEYLIRSFLEVRPKGLAKYQFSLGESLIGMTLFAVLLSCHKILGDAFWPLVIVFLLFVACAVEFYRRKSEVVAKKPDHALAAPSNDVAGETSNAPAPPQSDDY
jgi:membrane protein implicated in regulation of membrane protease activity